MTLFAFDFETFLIQPALAAPKAVCLSYQRPDQPPGLLHCKFDRAEVVATLREALLKDQIIGANTAFDLGVAWVNFPELRQDIWRAYDESRVFDVLLNEKLFDIESGHLGWTGSFSESQDNKKKRYDLDGLSQQHLNRPLAKDGGWRLKYGTLWDAPCYAWSYEARDYAITDAEVTLGVHFAQYERAAGVLSPDSAFQSRSAWWLHLASMQGVRVDAKTVSLLKQEVSDAIVKLKGKLFAVNLVDKSGKRNTKDAKARMEAVCASRGVEPKKTEADQISLDAEACRDSKDPVLGMYAQYTTLSNVLSKDIAALEEAAERGIPIQTRYDSLKETGRTGSSGGKTKKGQQRTAFGFQVQNVRKGVVLDILSDGTEVYATNGVRECFAPRPGYAFVSIDYGQMELHAWAQCCLTILGRSELANALNEGRDVHCQVGAMMVGRAYEDVLAGKKAKEAWALDARQMAKAANFGLPGGLGAASLIAYAKATYNLVLSLEQAQNLIAAWRAAWPEATAYFRWAANVSDRSQVIRQLGSQRIRGGVGYTRAANGMFQALAADCAKAAGYEISKRCYTADPSDPLYGSRLWGFVHDEFLLEVPLAKLHEAAMAATNIMLAAGKRWMPDCPPRAEPAAMLQWTKAADAKYDADGRLEPWTARKAA